MEWMSPIDSSFLHVENATTPMHIGAVSIFEGPPPPFEDLRAMVAGKLELVPRYRQKVRFVPLAISSPALIPNMLRLEAPSAVRGMRWPQPVSSAACASMPNGFSPKAPAARRIVGIT